MEKKVLLLFIGLFSTLVTVVKRFIPEVVPKVEPMYTSPELFDKMVGNADKMTEVAVYLKVVERDPMEVIKLGLAMATYGMCGYLVQQEEGGREGLIDELNRRLEDMMIQIVLAAGKPAKGVS